MTLLNELSAAKLNNGEASLVVGAKFKSQSIGRYREAYTAKSGTEILSDKTTFSCALAPVDEMYLTSQNDTTPSSSSSISASSAAGFRPVSPISVLTYTEGVLHYVAYNNIQQPTYNALFKFINVKVVILLYPTFVLRYYQEVDFFKA
jgi:hypothetical protein